MSKYKDELVQQLFANVEPDDSIENKDGEWFGLYPLDREDLVGVILYEDSEGGVSGTFFEDANELSEAWDELGDDETADQAD